MKRYILPVLALALAAAVSGCSVFQSERYALEAVAASESQWTGVAVSPEGRLFANYPRWSENVPVSVVELDSVGALTPYPNEDWNMWEPGLNPATHFICVQSVFCDRWGSLWVLDAANPQFKGVVEKGPKLVRIDLATNAVERVYAFDAAVAPKGSYLNDVRVDPRMGHAYITDSGTGALIVLNLLNGESRRVLAGHPSTQSEDATVTIGGAEWLRPDGSKPKVHADGLALSSDGKRLYYQALTGRTLYRIATEYLRDLTLDDEQIAGHVETVAQSGVADGLAFDRFDNLYITSLEYFAISRLTPKGKLSVLIMDPRIAWPDSIAVALDGTVYFTTSRIHEGDAPSGVYNIFKIVRRRGCFECLQ